MKRNKSGWMVTVTAGEIREKCGGRTDDAAAVLVKSVEGYPDNFPVTVQKSRLENKSDEELIAELNQPKSEKLKGKELKADDNQ